MRVYDFLLVRHSITLVLFCTGSQILQSFCTPPLFHPNIGVFLLDQIADVGVSPSIYLKLISSEIIFKVFQPM